MKKIRKMKEFGEPPAHFSSQPKMKRKGKKRKKSKNKNPAADTCVARSCSFPPLFLLLSLLSRLGNPETLYFRSPCPLSLSLSN